MKENNVSTNMTSNNLIGNESESDVSKNVKNYKKNSFHNNNGNIKLNMNLLHRNNSANEIIFHHNNKFNNNNKNESNNINQFNYDISNRRKYEKLEKNILMKNLTIKIQNGKLVKINNPNLTFKNYNKEISRNDNKLKKKLFVFNNNLSGFISPLLSNRQNN